MASNLRIFETIVRRAYRFTDSSVSSGVRGHPFEARNIHSDLPAQVRNLFDDGHYAQATLEAFKFVDEEIQKISEFPDYGTSLMMRAFGGAKPVLALNPGMTTSEKSEQEGFKFLFAGAMQGIRNPRGHSTSIADDPDTCLDHLCLASLLIRRLDEAGFR